MDFPKEFLKFLAIYGLDEGIYRLRPNYLRIHSDITPEKIEKRLGVKLRPVPWNTHYYAFPETPIPSWMLKDGEIVVQDVGSSIPVIALHPRKGERILDLCASPGLKTAYISWLMENTGRITAVERDRNRFERLGRTIRAYKLNNVEAVHADGRKFESALYDKVLVDAPCTTEGSIANIDKCLEIWSMERVFKLAEKQKKLLQRGFDLLKPGGILVYSTCSFAKEENEEIAAILLDKNPDARLDNITITGAVLRRGFTEKMVRVYPQDNITNGLFVAKIQKIA